MPRQFIIAVIGAVVGFAYGYATRPVVPFFSVPIDFSVLASQSPIDEPFKKMLIEHLATTTVISFFSFGVIADLWDRISRKNTNNS